MFSFIRKKERKIPLAAIIGVLALLVLGTFSLFGRFLFFGSIIIPANEAPLANSQINNESNGDPFITKAPGWQDRLSGPIISADDPSLGASGAKINLVQFADFSCSYSREQAEIIKQALTDFAGKIKFIHKDYPADKTDSASYQAAIAARCAGEQGKYWEYYDELLKNNRQLNQQNFLEIIVKLSLDKKSFLVCQASDQVKKLIAANIEEANNLQISGVPFLFVNQQEAMGEISLEDLKKMIEVELKRK